MPQKPGEPKTEERHVSKDELKEGVTLKAGHPVILLVGGVPGEPDPTGDEGDEGGGTATGGGTADGPTGPPDVPDDRGDEGEGQEADIPGDEGNTGEEGTGAHEGHEGVVEVTVRNAKGEPAAGVAYTLTLPDGTQRTGHTKSDGTIHEGGLPTEGECQLDFPELKPES
ncbi:MAG: hypothetical protein JST92_09710 [Deltaproteobacteria bacterium]|nr:hypothetical protein [Deltaproteobacteria bacterium]